ncbi:hypothetical protein Tco_0916892 [Tanacetum coccineum]
MRALKNSPLFPTEYLITSNLSTLHISLFRSLLTECGVSKFSGVQESCVVGFPSSSLLLSGSKNGRWSEFPILVKDEFLSYFASRFNKPPDYRLHIDLDFPNKLSLEQQMVLEIDVTREEIKKAVWDCKVDKSPGPDGSNSSFITLILKTQEAKMMKDFRPITLIGSLYKIIAKILANRLVVVLEDLVSDVQSAFVAKRQILDGPFILNELF